MNLKAWKTTQNWVCGVEFNSNHKQSCSAMCFIKRKNGIHLFLGVLLFHLLSSCYITPVPFRAEIMLHSGPTLSDQQHICWMLVAIDKCHSSSWALIIPRTFVCIVWSAHVAIIVRWQAPAGVWRKGFYFCLRRKVCSISSANKLTFNCPHQRDVEKFKKLVLFPMFKQTENTPEILGI